MAKLTPEHGLIVLGVPRSGTTLVRRLLDAHPRIACGGETSLLSGAGRFLRSEQGAEGVDFGVLSGLSYAGFDEETVLARVRELVVGFKREYAVAQNKPLWAEKTAMDCFHLRAIERLFVGHASFLCVLRHGLDVVESLKDFCERSQAYLGEIHGYITRYPRPADAFARVWVDVTNELLDFAERHPDDVRVLRYEDLVASPDAVMKQTLEAFGETWEPAWLEVAMRSPASGFGDWRTYQRTHVDAASVGRWRNLGAFSLRAAARNMNDTLVRAGYEPIAAASAEQTEDEARRKYEIGLMLQRMKTGD